MKHNSEEIYAEKLITISKTEDYNSIRILLDSNNIEYVFKSQLKPELCTGSNIYPINKTTFFVKTENIVQATSICEEIINKLKNQELKRFSDSRSLLDKIIDKIKNKI